MVIKASTKGENKEAVLSIEIQVAKREGFAKRMFVFCQLNLMKIAAIPIAVFAADHVFQKKNLPVILSPFHLEGIELSFFQG